MGEGPGAILSFETFLSFINRLLMTIYFAAENGETLYSQQAQDRELTGSDHEFLIAKFRLKLKKVGKTTRPFRYGPKSNPS